MYLNLIDYNATKYGDVMVNFDFLFEEILLLSNSR